MTLEDALRLTGILIGLASIQQGAEHLCARHLPERLLGAARIALATLLVLGVEPAATAPALLAVGIAGLHRFQGPYNGGSDRMTLLILACLSAAHMLPEGRAQDLAFGYLAAQLVMSYVVSGWVKVVNPDWRDGTALSDVFRFSAYPVSDGLRSWSGRPVALRIASWAVMLLELLFPLVLLHPIALTAGLVATAAFHFSNACFFGLNRFFWAWIAAYPSLIWLQSRVFP